MKQCNLRIPAWGLLFVSLCALGEWALRLHHRRQHIEDGVNGLRPEARNVRPEDLAGHLRVVALGDSITHGMDLPCEQTYPAILEDALQERLNGRPVTVINAGIAGQTALHGLQRLWRDVIRFRPHITLIAFGLNDASLSQRLQDARRERDEYPEGLAGILNRLHLYRTLRARGRRLLIGLGLRPASDYADASTALPRSSMRAYGAALRELVRQIRRHTAGRVVLLTMHPIAAGGGDGSEVDAQQDEQARVYRHYNDVVRAVARQTGAGLVDVELAFRQRDAGSFLQADGVHLTAEGQRFLAELICQSLLSGGLLSE